MKLQTLAALIPDAEMLTPNRFDMPCPATGSSWMPLPIETSHDLKNGWAGDDLFTSPSHDMERIFRMG